MGLHGCKKGCVPSVAALSEKNYYAHVDVASEYGGEYGLPVDRIDDEDAVVFFSDREADVDGSYRGWKLMYESFEVLNGRSVRRRSCGQPQLR